MKLTINTKNIEKLNSREYNLKDWIHYHGHFKGSIEDFLNIKNMIHSDKLLTVLQLVPKLIAEEFVIDCAMHATAKVECDISKDSVIKDAILCAESAAFVIQCISEMDCVSWLDCTQVINSAVHVAFVTSYNQDDAVHRPSDIEKQRQIESLIYLIHSYKEVQLDEEDQVVS